MTETRRDVFQAIADPTRRRIIGLLVEKPRSLNSIAGEFDITRQAVSLQVKILAECGLISITQHGRERHCEAKLDSLTQVSAWVEQYKKQWEQQLNRLDNYLQTLQRNKKHGKSKK